MQKIKTLDPFVRDEREHAMSLIRRTLRRIEQVNFSTLAPYLTLQELQELRENVDRTKELLTVGRKREAVKEIMQEPKTTAG